MAVIESTNANAQTDRNRVKIGLPSGATPLYACRADQRFSYCLYLPPGLNETEARSRPVVVTVHGTGRRALEYRDAFVDFAEAHDCVILAPLFPGGIVEPWELGSYKLLKNGDLRYDRLLLAMIDEVACAVPIDTRRFLLHGFSGGGQFVHRFFYVHPDRLMAVSIGAPGAVTLLDHERDWWVGVRNLAAEFEIEPDYAAMRQVPVQVVIGGEDTDDVTIQPEERRWMAGANDAGVTRVARLAALRASFERQGIAVQHDIVPDVGHDGFTLLGPVKAFFAETLRRQNDRTRRP
jgi:poly(3-hydroxybutyrate) depolymerase